MMIRDVIAEFPYTGTITRRFFTADVQELPPVIVYEGIMDEHMVTEEEGRTLHPFLEAISKNINFDAIEDILNKKYCQQNKFYDSL